MTSWDETKRVLIAKPATGFWEVDALHDVIVDHTAVVVPPSYPGHILKHGLSLKFIARLIRREVEDAGMHIENDQLVRLEALLMAVDQALVMHKLDGKVKRPCYERPDDPKKLADLAFNEIQRIENDLKQAFGQHFGLEQLLESKE
jgi:hypothetical protein